MIAEVSYPRLCHLWLFFITSFRGLIATCILVGTINPKTLPATFSLYPCKTVFRHSFPHDHRALGRYSRVCFCSIRFVAWRRWTAHFRKLSFWLTHFPIGDFNRRLSYPLSRQQAHVPCSEPLWFKSLARAYHITLFRAARTGAMHESEATRFVKGVKPCE